MLLNTLSGRIQSLLIFKKQAHSKITNLCQGYSMENSLPPLFQEQQRGRVG
jgi:hypothetical protein